VLTGPGERATVRDVLRARCWRDGDTVLTEVEANAFLPHMMRHLVGALINVGRRRLAVDEFERRIVAGDRRGLGPAAPPGGLYLVQVTYNGGNET
jgi:tRNA pseudouridine38-40 synthase